MSPLSISSARPHLNRRQLFAYGLLSMPIAWSSTLLITFVPTYYAINMGLGLGVVGGLFVAGRLLDVITDPLIGYASDRTRSRFGSRSPWMVVGMVFFIPLLLLILMPVGSISPVKAGLMIGLFFIAYTLLDLPYSATGLEMSPHRHERTVLASVKAAFQVAGALTCAVVVALTPDVMSTAFQQSALWITALLILGITLFMRGVPTYPQPTGRPLSLKRALITIWADLRYRQLMIAFFLTQTGSALIFGLTALFILHNFGDGSLTGMFVVLVLLSSAFALPIWLWVSKRFGKMRVWQIALIGGAASLWLVPILEPGNTFHFAAFCILVGSVFGADAVLPTSLLADISDDLTTDDAGSAAMMLGYKNALSKLGFVAPMGIAFPILGMLGFDGDIMVGDSRHWALIFFYALLPALLRLAAFLAVKSMPADEVTAS
ncbi:MFS transporter [Algimonas arctica]|nr:MFS transporter [Algimonas arctica]